VLRASLYCTHLAQCGCAAKKKIKRQKSKGKNQKFLSRAVGRAGKGSSGAGRNQSNRQFLGGAETPRQECLCYPPSIAIFAF
jgi:hypothetical protein